MALDETDRAILRELQLDGRLPYTKLGSAVGLSEAAARQRVQRLLDSGVMQVVAVTDPLQVGMGRMAMIGVRAEGDLDEVGAQLAALDDVEYLVVVAGSVDFLIEVVVADDEALLQVMNAIRAVPGVHETETFVYLRLAKQTFAWGARPASTVAGVELEVERDPHRRSAPRGEDGRAPRRAHTRRGP